MMVIKLHLLKAHIRAWKTFERPSNLPGFKDSASRQSLEICPSLVHYPVLRFKEAMGFNTFGFLGVSCSPRGHVGSMQSTC
jgi:hypothetical protein